MHNTVTDRQRLASIVRSLARIGRALCSSTDFKETLAAVVSASVPDLFSAMRIQTCSVDGRPDIVAGSELFEAPDAITIVLDAGGEIVGTLSVQSRSVVPDEIDYDIAADVGHRIGLAVHSMRALARQHHVADYLQRALLPQRLPQGGPVSASAAYLPGTQEAIVGGDWYDAFNLPDGRTAFSIGDVVGHGLRAAVVMGEVRQAFRAAAVDPKSPSLVLDRANTIVNMRADTAIVTAVFGILDRKTSTVTYAVAGHPPPILAMRDGIAHTLPSQGIPLGIDVSVFTRDWTFTLPPGSIFALYTHGLTEHSRDVTLGEEQLIAAVRMETVVPSANPAQTIVDRVFKQRDNADDVAALVFAVDDVTPERFLFEFSALPLAVPMLRRALASFMKRKGLNDDDASAVLLAVGEAAANAVEHAYRAEPGLVRVAAELVNDTLVVDVHDAGRWKPAEHREERGRGIKIMRALMDHIEIRTMQAETHVRLTLKLHGPIRPEGPI